MKAPSAAVKFAFQGGNINLMNPQAKLISRNEEWNLAKKRGFLGFENHESF